VNAGAAETFAVGPCIDAIVAERASRVARGGRCWACVIGGGRGSQSASVAAWWGAGVEYDHADYVDQLCALADRIESTYLALLPDFAGPSDEFLVRDDVGIAGVVDGYVIMYPLLNSVPTQQRVFAIGVVGQGVGVFDIALLEVGGQHACDK
jgi:hypothetical protein